MTHVTPFNSLLLLLRFLKLLTHLPSVMNRQSPPFPSHSPKSRRHLSHLRNLRPSHPPRSLLRSRSSRLPPIDPRRKSLYQSQLFRISLPTPRSLRARAYRHPRLSPSLYPNLHPNLILSLRNRSLRLASLRQGQQHQNLGLPLLPLHPYFAQLLHHPLRQRRVQNLKSPLSLLFRLRHHPSLDLPCKLNRCRPRPRSQLIAAHFRLASPLLRHRNLERRKTLVQLRRSLSSVARWLHSVDLGPHRRRLCQARNQKPNQRKLQLPSSPFPRQRPLLQRKLNSL